jgi:hypothetical protein
MKYRDVVLSEQRSIYQRVFAKREASRKEGGSATTDVQYRKISRDATQETTPKTDVCKMKPLYPRQLRPVDIFELAAKTRSEEEDSLVRFA